MEEGTWSNHYFGRLGDRAKASSQKTSDAILFLSHLGGTKSTEKHQQSLDKLQIVHAYLKVI